MVNQACGEKAENIHLSGSDGSAAHGLGMKANWLQALSGCCIIVA